MIDVIYNKNYNIDLGLLNFLHPFDGLKFLKIFNNIKDNTNVTIATPLEATSQATIDEFTSKLLTRFLRHREHIFQSIEIPKIPFVTFSMLDKRILLPMRWGVSGTLFAAKSALKGNNCWNLAGGYHHASQHSSEGFCIYNDIGISYQELIKSGELTDKDKILIIDTDAHHGNGNARTFKENSQVTLLDVYNRDIYPQTETTRERVDISVPLSTGVNGNVYLSHYQAALNQLDGQYKIAFIVAGTDVLTSDRLGGMCLTQEDVVQREIMTLTRLKQLGIPAVFLGGGGYSKESATAISAAINAVSELV